MPWLMLGYGALKGLQDQKAAERDRQLQAQTAQWSPWTNLKPQPVHNADMLGTLATSGLTGAQFAQGQEQAAAQQKLNEAQLKNMDEQTNYLKALQAQRLQKPTNNMSGNDQGISNAQYTAWG